MKIIEFRGFTPYTQGLDAFVTNWVIELVVDNNRIFEIVLSPQEGLTLPEWETKEQDLIDWVNELNTPVDDAPVDDTPLTLLGWEQELVDNTSDSVFLEATPPGTQHLDFKFI